MWFAVPTVTEVNGNCDSSSLVNMVICYFGSNMRRPAVNVTLHTASGLVDNKVGHAFSMLDSGICMELQKGS